MVFVILGLCFRLYWQILYFTATLECPILVIVGSQAISVNFDLRSPLHV